LKLPQIASAKRVTNAGRAQLKSRDGSIDLETHVQQVWQIAINSRAVEQAEQRPRTGGLDRGRLTVGTRETEASK
jgi:hypothetical protein